MDSRLYELPQEFVPERWLEKDKESTVLANKYAFGFGRR